MHSSKNRWLTVFVTWALVTVSASVGPAAYAAPPTPDASTLVGATDDVDGDGLPDSWESLPGRDVGDGTFDQLLYEQGASPEHKDIFVQIDAERGAELSAKAKQKLINSFAQAPVSNPDGRIGIRLHLINGPTLSSNESDALRMDNDYPDWYGSSTA